MLKSKEKKRLSLTLILTETGIPLRDGNGDSIQASVCNKVLDVDFWSASCSCSGCWSIGADPLVPKLL